MLARLLQGVAVVLFAASITFFLIKALPGDQFSERSTNPNISAETLARFRARSGNDEPLLAQYWIWISSAAQGDLNRSDIFNKPVARVIGQHLPATLQLMSLAFVASMVGGIALGTWQGTATGSRAERLSGAVSLALVSIPEFWLAMILLLVFAINVHWFPTQGMSNLNHDGTVVGIILNRLHHLFLPWLSLTLLDIAVISRYHRAAMRDVMGQQFLRTARAKGVPEHHIKWKHALRVAVLPIITIAGLYFPALFVGAVLIEQLFSWPGIGSVLPQAIASRDYFLVAGIVVVGSAMTATGSFLADVTRERLDPRLRR